MAIQWAAKDVVQLVERRVPENICAGRLFHGVVGARIPTGGDQHPMVRPPQFLPDCQRYRPGRTTWYVVLFGYFFLYLVFLFVKEKLV